MLTVGCGGLAGTAGGCGADEKRVFAEFPQFGGATPEPHDDVEGTGCGAELTLKAPLDDVLAYYRHQLRRRGWRVGGVNRQVGEGVGGAKGYVGGMGARRNGFHYSLTFEAGEILKNGGTNLVVRVARSQD
jgi:hypothetical protein